jgi:thiol-disulfide isomerase/thioredoxin
MNYEWRKFIAAILVAVILFASIVAILFAFGLFTPAKPAYEFKTGVNHPQQISDLMKNGTVVLYFTMYDCPPCDNMTPRIGDLQSQYKGTDVTFMTFNISESGTSQKMGASYGIDTVPTVLVIRGDGAVATFVGLQDISPIKSAIEDAQKWQSPNAATQHDAFLEKLLAAVKNNAYSNSNASVKAWELTWINSTSARLQATERDKPSNYTWNHDITYVVFPTSQDATNYLNAMNKTAYSLYSTETPNGTVYQNVTGYAPQIYKQYTWNEGNPSNISEFKGHVITQINNVLVVDTAKVLFTS